MPKKVKRKSVARKVIAYVPCRWFENWPGYVAIPRDKPNAVFGPLGDIPVVIADARIYKTVKRPLKPRKKGGR